MEIDVGYSHTCALPDNDSVVCWGFNGRGQLGVGHLISQSTPAAVRLPAGRVVQEIHARLDHTCAVLDDNSLACWGANYYGQLLDGTTIDRYWPVRVEL